MTQARLLLLALAALLAAAASLQAQNFNLDVGDPGTEPPDTYAGAGLAGHWNQVTAEHVTPFTTGRTPQDILLVDVDGNQTNVGFHQFGGMDHVTDSDPGVTGNDALLLDDVLITHSAVLESCMYLNGLEDGMYEVIVYAWMPNRPLVDQKVRFDFHAGCEIVGGAWPGQHEENVTYSRHLINVTGGFMGFHVGIPAGGNEVIGAAFNGFQVRRVVDDPIEECGVGAVNAGCGATEDVLFLNGSAGGITRTFDFSPTDQLSFTVAEPSSRIGDLASTRVCLYATVGEPGPDDVVTLPQGLGPMCYGPFLLATKAPIRTWNSVGRENKLGPHNGPGGPPVIPDGGLAQFLNLPFGAGQAVTLTFQGIIQDDCSQGAAPFSVTNGFVVKIQ